MISYVDYAIVIFMLSVSACTGLYFGIWGGGQRTNVDYLFAGRSMSIFPVAFSLMGTFMSTTALMGLPAEMYLFGTHMAFECIGYAMGTVLACYVFLPIYFEIEVFTTYEYLEKRFGPSTRKVLSGISIVSSVMYNGVILYAPALALSAVTSLSMWTSVISIGVICTFYCTIGGIKAVLWTDVFQSILMYTCLFVIIVKGWIDLGGFSSIFRDAYEGGRIVLPTFLMDFSARYTIYSVVLMGIIINLNSYGCHQAFLQRHLSLKNLKSAIIASLVSATLLFMFHLLACLCGIIFYAYFKDCDPITSPQHPIHSADQLMPYYIVQFLSQYPGLPGLCIAGIFSASLSSISSTVNSMAAITYEDFIKQLFPDPSKSVLITKAASAFYGLLSIFVSFLGSSLGNLIRANMMIVGATSGPCLGMFLLAVSTTTANEMGATLGILAGFIVAGCLAFIPNPVEYATLPVGKDCCNLTGIEFNGTVDCYELQLNDTSSQIDALETPLPASTEEDFPLSYMWIGPIGLVTTVVIGFFSSLVISWCTAVKCNKMQQIMKSSQRNRAIQR